MGIFNAIYDGLSKLASHSRDTVMLWQIFQEHQGYAKLSFQLFERAAADRNIEVTEELILEAQREASKYPKMLIGEFLDGYTNRRMNSALRRY